jgi:hypothetical protein
MKTIMRRDWERSLGNRILDIDEDCIQWKDADGSWTYLIKDILEKLGWNSS